MRVLDVALVERVLCDRQHRRPLLSLRWSSLRCRCLRPGRYDAALPPPAKWDLPVSCPIGSFLRTKGRSWTWIHQKMFGSPRHE
jgi:hypothetical protein